MNFTKEKATMTPEEFSHLLALYRENKDISARNKIVMNYAYIPQTVAIQLRGLASGYAQVDDMVNQGIITLMDCLDKFDETKGIAFEYYAFMRVRGGIIDLVRKQDWIPRRVREMDKKINATRNLLANKLLREPTMEEIAAEMDIDVKKLYESSNEINNSVVFSFEELIQNMSQMGTSLETDGLSPEKKLIREEMEKALVKAIDDLSERERLVVSLYYYNNMTLTDIAEVIEVSVQRVSQINAKAVAKLRKALEDYIYG